MVEGRGERECRTTDKKKIMLPTLMDLIRTILR